MHLLRQIIAVVLISFLVVPRGFAQSFELKHNYLFTVQAAPQAESSPKGPVVHRLRIVPLEGQGAGNIITARTPMAVVVTVLDENDRPVEGVAVTFQAPASGPSGVFATQRPTYNATTDNRGQAGVLDFMANDKPGRFDIRVTAKYQDITATLILHQTNYFTAEDRSKTEAKPLLRNWKFYAIAGGVAAGVIAILVLTRSDASPIAVSAGPVSFVAR